MVTPKLLQEKGIVHDIRFGVKILGDGVVTKNITVKECTVSASAKEKIEKAGGTVTS